jgi:hypothetical protein
MSNTSIEPDWNSWFSSFFGIFVGFLNDFTKDLDGSWCGVELSSSMIAHIYPIYTIFERKSGILTAHDALAEDW